MRTSDVKHADDCKCSTCKRKRNEPEKYTCSCCGKQRLCKQVERGGSGPRSYDPHYCIKECLNLTTTERRSRYEQAYRARRKKRQDAPPLAWPIIGGPLDGLYAVPADFWGEGRYQPHCREYAEFNSGSRSHKRIGASPSMVYIHRLLLKPMIRGADR
jgi:hypothetical protein